MNNIKINTNQSFIGESSFQLSMRKLGIEASDRILSTEYVFS